ncbi:hypothetical protein K443DRAFT_11055 [Laccaria amethystina LaAM-08-1]|uniref:Uncharacterized protein n=1 Tax=Laccaria amethystina LaAM-08-1 TaxID=1095629 RepID=A0A0C9WK57_9AGAR|nr:hypothetical protein K443DRAFT_11055 [Laccaria amethystina LaAM-08-1]
MLPSASAYPTTKNSLDGIPMRETRVFGKTRNRLNGKRNVGASSEGGVHKRAYCFQVRDVAHLGDFEGGGWSQRGGEANAGLHRRRCRLQVLEIVTGDDGIDEPVELPEVGYFDMLSDLPLEGDNKGKRGSGDGAVVNPDPRRFEQTPNAAPGSLQASGTNDDPIASNHTMFSANGKPCQRSWGLDSQGAVSSGAYHLYDKI